jgi:hypothetical protein
MATSTTIRLLGDCENDGVFCVPLMEKIRGTVDKTKYRQGAALMEMPESREAWEADHRTARKRAWRSERLGYRFAPVDLSQHSDDVFDINTSLATRQGRPMTAGYVEYHQQGKLPDYPCERHAIRTYGVTISRLKPKLVAYMSVYRINELVLISMILGHGNFLTDDIMYLLFAGMVEQQSHLGGWLYYNRWDSGTDGLRYYKEKTGFREGDIRWER